VKTAPSDTNVVFARPGSNVTLVSGLTVPGTYTFTLTLVDRNAYATRDVSVTVLLPEPALLAALVLIITGRKMNTVGVHFVQSGLPGKPFSSSTSAVPPGHC